ncbi:MAG: hypothetical protein ACPGYT_13985 [Nitrospirales bacterium]
MKIHDHQRLALVLFSNLLLWLLTISVICWGAGHAFAVDEISRISDSTKRVHLSAEAVENAWEEFHSSAIGGTLASPMIQTQIEQQLHQARGLLMKARKAKRRGDYSSVLSITDQVIYLAKTIVASSREKKP